MFDKASKFCLKAASTNLNYCNKFVLSSIQETHNPISRNDVHLYVNS